MNRPTRMVKMLGCLVCSMSGAAALLAWIEPGSNGVSDGPAQIAELVHLAVGIDPAVALRPWNVVQISHDPNALISTGGRLTATIARDEHHFMIGPDGSLTSTPEWQSQKVSDRRRVIQVMLAGRGEGGRVPTPQWLTLRALLSELRRTIADDSGELALTIDDRSDPPRRSTSLAAHLQQLLASYERHATN